MSLQLGMNIRLPSISEEQVSQITMISLLSDNEEEEEEEEFSDEEFSQDELSNSLIENYSILETLKSNPRSANTTGQIVTKMMLESTSNYSSDSENDELEEEELNTEFPETVVLVSNLILIYLLISYRTKFLLSLKLILLLTTLKRKLLKGS